MNGWRASVPGINPLFLCAALVDRAVCSAILFLIGVYRAVFSPLKIYLFGPYCRCRFRVTCSQYAMEMYANNNFFRATLFTLRRLMKCHPFCEAEDE